MKRKAFLCIIFIYSLLNGLVYETASLKDFIYGETDSTSYDNWQSHVVESTATFGYVYAPFDVQSDGFGTFDVPDSSDTICWTQIIDNILDNNLNIADSLISEQNWPYELVAFHDTDVDRDYLMLRELINPVYVDSNNGDYIESGSFDKGWGLYIFNYDSDNSNIISTPHPSDDFVSVPVSCYAFQKLNARYWFMSGASRGAAISDFQFSPDYSLSDPTRNNVHPNNAAYKTVVDRIRAAGEPEFCLQMHSYDSHGDNTYKPVEITTGRAYTVPGHPIRDFSGNNLDLVNFTPYLVVNNYIGLVYNNVNIDDYYSIKNTSEGIYRDGSNFQIDDYPHLRGYYQNRQALYTNNYYDDEDMFSHFMHVELSEFPYAFYESYPYFSALYEEYNGTFSSRFNRIVQFYEPFVDALAQSMMYYNEFDDGLTPDAPELRNCRDGDFIGLIWSEDDSYDFHTYKIYYSNNPIPDSPDTVADTTIHVIDRENDPLLALPVSARLSALDYNLLDKYVRIQVLDKNGNQSPLSNEVNAATINVDVSSYSVIETGNGVEIEWTTVYQNNNAGFVLYRSEWPFDNDVLIAHYQVQQELAGSTAQDSVLYSFTDSNVENNKIYNYSLYYYDTITNQEIEVVPEIGIHLEDGYNIVHDNHGNESIYTISNNYYAEDGLDDLDVLSTDHSISRYSGIRDENYYDLLYTTSRKQFYDSTETYKEWLFTTYRCSGNNVIKLEQQPDSVSSNERMLIRSGNLYCDLLTDSLVYTESSNGIIRRYFNIYWGNLIPNISTSLDTVRYYSIGDSLKLNWYNDKEFALTRYYITAGDSVNSTMVTASLSTYSSSFKFLLSEDFLGFTTFTLHAVMYDNTELQFEFPPVFVNPVSQEYEISTGLNQVTFSNLSTSVDIQSTFGNTLTAYKYIDSVFVAQSSLTNGSYILKSSQNNSLNMQNCQFPDGPRGIMLYSGWNLIGSPFPHDYPLTSCEVISDGVTMSFNDAINAEIIGGYGFDYFNADPVNNVIESGKSVWIYSFADSVEMTFNVYPDQSINAICPSDFNHLELCVTNIDQSNSAKFLVGSNSNVPQGYNPALDLLSPPNDLNVLQVFTIEDSLHFFRNIKSFTNEENSLIDFNVRVISQAGDSVRFSISASSYDFDKSFYVFDGADRKRLYFGHGLTFLNSTGTLDLTLRIQNFETSNDVNEFEFVPLANYPNPFNPETTINFSIHKPEEVELKIYNIKGQLVKTLIDEKIEPGVHKVIWKGRNNNNKQVASGVYFIKLKASTNTDIRKTILLK